MDINGIVGQNLRALREQKKLSLEAVAKLSGVSKSMLGQIERGLVSPTVTTLWKIAGGLRVTFTELVERPTGRFEVTLRRETAPLPADGGHYRNWPVLPFGSQRRFEMYYIEIDPGHALAASAHPAGTEEFITLFAGRLQVEVAGNTLTVEQPGDALRFLADTAHRYQSTGSEMCRLSMVLYYPR